MVILILLLRSQVIIQECHHLAVIINLQVIIFSLWLMKGKCTVQAMAGNMAAMEMPIMTMDSLALESLNMKESVMMPGLWDAWTNVNMEKNL